MDVQMVKSKFHFIIRRHVSAAQAQQRSPDLFDRRALREINENTYGHM